LLLGLPGQVQDKDMSKHLVDMIGNSMGKSLVGVVVEAFGMVETQDLLLQVRPKALEEVTT